MKKNANDPECRPPKTRTRRLLDLLWQSPIVAAPFALFFGALNGGSWPVIVLCYKLSLIFSYSIRLALWGVEGWVMPRLRSSRAGVDFQIGKSILAYSAAAAIGSLVAALICQRTILPDFLGSPRNLFVWAMFTLLFFGFFGGIGFARAFYEKAVEKARAVEQIRAELAQAELRALRAQLQPHFLFNTLNSIAALIPENPRAAEETLTRLADVLRYTLQTPGREHAALRDELAFVRAYLDIERTRMGERLRVTERIEPGLDAVPVPPLLLQPIVENAIVHGIGAKPGGGTVAIAARAEGPLLVLEVRDDGVGMDAAAAPRGHGLGLSAARERLHAAGLPHQILIHSEPGRGTVVTMKLPMAPAGSNRS